LAVRIPRAIAKEARFNEGDCLALAIDRDGSIVLRPARRRYELSELVSRIRSKNRHRETDWDNRKVRNPLPRQADLFQTQYRPEWERKNLTVLGS
jgi:antitoxin component of MazEF toxin-antitoxin module